MIVWRPILQGHVSLEAVLDGRVPLHRLIELNGLLDMKADIEKQAYDRS